MEWLPIETAPRDGTVVDLWIKTEYGNFRITDCKWGNSDWNHSGTGQWIFEARDESETHRDAWHDVFYVYGDGSVTHWMPLPEPPK